MLVLVLVLDDSHSELHPPGDVARGLLRGKPPARARLRLRAGSAYTLERQSLLGPPPQAVVSGLFIDTAGWMAMADAADAEYDSARSARDDNLRRGGLLVTTDQDYVVDETLTLIRFRLGLRAASTWWDQIEGSSRIRWDDELIRLSGGQPAELMTLMREAIVTNGLPIDEASLARVTLNGQRAYSRQLRADHWPIVAQVRAQGRFVRTKETEQAFRELLDGRAILQYVNDDIWYGLNPMVAELEPPAAQGGTPGRTEGTRRRSAKGTRTRRPSAKKKTRRKR